jgi:hypothetical protein
MSAKHTITGLEKRLEMNKYKIGIFSLLATLLSIFVVGCGQELVVLPSVVSTVPASGATNVLVTTTISATFNMAMNPSTINGSTFTVTGPGGTAVAGSISYAGTTATFTPSANLDFSSVYTATITNGATNLGGTPLITNYVWSFTTITPPPIVISTIPVNTATGVPVNQIISATFKEAMNCTTIASPATTFLLNGPGGVPVAGTVGCSGSTATFTPEVDLALNTVYTATITTGVQDIAGTPMALNYVWSFKTVPVTAALTIISTVPVNQATGVAVNKAISATFSEAMNAATVNTSTFTLTAPGDVVVTGVVTYVASGSIATFTPAAALVPNTIYTATITTGAIDLGGTTLAQNYVWTFTTAGTIVDIPPTVIATIPLNGAVNVPLNQIVNATFSEAMNPATISSDTFMLTGPGTTPVSGFLTYSAIANTLTFTPTVILAPSTVYTGTITTGVMDLAGTAMVSNYVWSFTTGTTSSTTAPELVSTVPANLATNVPLNQSVSATFTEAMDPLTITTGTFLLTGPSGSVAGTVTYDALNYIATFTPAVLLTDSSIYTATVTDGATDLFGNPLGTSGATNPWSFTTGTATVNGPGNPGSASVFGSFGGTSGVTNQGIYTVINGDIGTTAASTLVTGFHDTTVLVGGVYECTYTETPLNIGQVNGTINTAAPPPTVSCPNEGTATTFSIASQAALDALSAYNILVAYPAGIDVSIYGGGAGELGNLTLAPGVYTSAPGSYAISLGNLTLDAQGDPNAFWVFQMATTLTVGTPSAPESVILVNGAQAKNVFWQVGSAATINGILGGGTMEGTIIAQDGISISTAGVVAITTLNGRALVLSGPVTMVNTVVNVPAP